MQRAGTSQLPNLIVPRNERHRRPGDLRHDRAGPVRLHQRHGHRPRAGVELLVPHHELRLPAEGERRDRLPVHQRQPRRRRAASTCSSARWTAIDFTRLVRGLGQGPLVRLRRLRPRPAVHRQRQAAGRQASNWPRPARCRSRPRSRSPPRCPLGTADGGQLPRGQDAARSS